MKKITIYIFVFSSLIFSSCKEDKIQKYKLSILLNENIGLKENDLINNNIKQLINYKEIKDSNGNVTFFFPDVEFIRTDFNPIKNEQLKIELTTVNPLSKFLPLSAQDYKDSYDEQIPILKATALLTLPTGTSILLNNIQAKYPDAEFIPMDDSINIRIERYRSKIINEISDNSKNNFTVVLYKVNVALKPFKEDTTVSTIDTTVLKNQTTITTVTENEKVVTKEKTVVKEDTKCKSQVFATDAQSYVTTLTAQSIDDCRKSNIATSFSSLFTSGGIVVIVDNNGVVQHSFNPPSSYVSHIRGKGLKIKIDEQNSLKDSNSKYSKLAVREP